MSPTAPSKSNVDPTIRTVLDLTVRHTHCIAHTSLVLDGGLNHVDPTMRTVLDLSVRHCIAHTSLVLDGERKFRIHL